MSETQSPLKCRNPNCTIATTGRCARAAEFADPLKECPDLVRTVKLAEDALEPDAGTGDVAGGEVPTTPEPSPDSAPAPSAPPTQADQDVPNQPSQTIRAFWSGEALTWSEANALMGASPARLFAVLGYEEAGKTCLLTSAYLQLAGGHRRDFPYRIAGSKTFKGFQHVVDRALGWRGDPSEAIVPRTSRSLDPWQDSLFLHLALRPDAYIDDCVVHTLFTDFPGEWFKVWAETGRLADRP
ncbi:MAG: hypothetical protein D6743_17445, partial [Calditrichaeota bacterium]